MIEPKGSVAGHGSAGPVTDGQARRSALVVAGVLHGIAAWNLYRGRMTVVFILGGLGVLLLVAGLFVPPAARAFHTAWMRFAVMLGHVNSRILLTLVYYLVVTPYGVVTRLVGRDPLRRRGRAKVESHWVERKVTRQAREQFERLF